MTSTIIPANDKLNPATRNGLGIRLARALIIRKLAGLAEGQLVIHEADASWTFGKPSQRLPKPIKLEILHASAWLDFAFGGSTAAGEAFMKGLWQCNDLTSLVRLFIRNRDVLDGLESNQRWLVYPVRQLGYWLRRNTRRGSRRNIQAHYDIGNPLFRLFLDKSLMYSSAFYARQDMTLDEAAEAKLDRVCRKLDLRPEHHLLEIGTGWGGMAIHAARYYGCRVTTTTISREQYELARERVAEQGLSDRIQVLFEDYRDLTGQYDRIVSIEMIEAVGHQYMRDYFSRCSALLKDDGRMLLQAITMTDRFYEQALNDVDFIKRYIFPGGFLPSVTAMTAALTEATDMKVSHMEDLAYHYARTLRDWHERFMNRLDEVRALGYPEEFIRLWQFYLCYSEGAFSERHCGVVQMLLTKPDDIPADVCY